MSFWTNFCCLKLFKWIKCELNFIIIYITQDYLDLPVIGGDSASENDSDEKSSDIVEGDTLWSARGHVDIQHLLAACHVCDTWHNVI